MPFNYIFCFVFIAFYFRIIMSLTLTKESTVEKIKNSEFTLLREANVSIMSMDIYNSRVTNNITKIRAKRQSGGAGKFTEAAKVTQLKIMRLFMQLFKNLWDPSYIGGSHPFHPDVPKTVGTLYRQKIVEFFVPNVGEDPDKPTA